MRTVVLPVPAEHHLNQHLQKKRKIYYCSFQDSWLHNYHSWLKKIDSYTALCTICNSKFTVKHDGEKALTRHSNNEKHKESAAAIKQSTTMNTFFTKKSSSDDKKVAATEITFVYHTVVHNHSYNSLDCTMKLNATCFADSKISKMLHCGRTKAASITKNVLLPDCVNLCKEYLLGKFLNYNNVLYYTLATDASNKGNKKMFPVILYFFHPKTGLNTKLIDFIEQSDESSSAIAESLYKALNDVAIDPTRIIAYSADNAAVNYGKNNSVYVHLKQKNNYIFKGNCHCHILHNCARHASKLLEYDVETLILKVYAEFAISSKKK